jgi:hypothetical protein
VSALFDYPAVFHDQDPVQAVEIHQSMGDEENGFSTGNVEKRF